MFERLIWFAPAAVAIAGAWRPRAGLVVLAACLPLFGSPPGGPYLAALDAAALAAILTAWRARSADRPRCGSRLDLPVAGVAVVSLASLLPLAYHPPSWQPRIIAGVLGALPLAQTWSALYTWRAAANLLLGIGLYAAVRRAFPPDRNGGRDVGPLGAGLGVGLLLVLAIGLVAQAGLIDLGGYRAIGGALYATRLHSLFFHSGWLAEYALIAAPFAVASLLVAGGGRSGAASRAAAMAVVALLFVTLPLTEQRGAWCTAGGQILLLGVLLVPGLRRDPGRLRALATAGAAALAATVAVGGLVLVARPELLDPVVARAQHLDLSGRTRLWQAAVELTSRHPWLGWGLGGFGVAFDLFHPPGTPGFFPFRGDAHSFYLTVAAQCGLLGVASYLVLATAITAGLWRAAHVRPESTIAGSLEGSEAPPGDRAADRGRLALGLVVSFAGFAVYSLVQSPFHLANTEWLFWVLVAAAAAISPPAAPPGLAGRAALLVAAVALLAALGRSAAQHPLARGDRAYGFNEREPQPSGQPVQWTAGSAGRRLPWEGSELIVPLSNGHPRPDQHPVTVRLRAAGVARELTLEGGGWSDVRLPVGKPRAPWLVLEIEARPTFRPFNDFRRHPGLAPSDDIRSLGVATRPIRWEGGADRHD